MVVVQWVERAEPSSHMFAVFLHVDLDFCWEKLDTWISHLLNLELGDESRIFENMIRHKPIQSTCTSSYQWQTGLEAL